MKILKNNSRLCPKNAIHYGGKAQQGAVISALFNEGMKKKKLKITLK